MIRKNITTHVRRSSRQPFGSRAIAIILPTSELSELGPLLGQPSQTEFAALPVIQA